MPEKPLPDVWTDRDFPVLVEVTRRVDAGETIVATTDVAEALGMPLEDVERAGAALERRELLTTMGTAARRVRHMKHLSGEAYVLTGLHPSPEAGADRLIAALKQAIADAPEGERKNRLQKLRDALLSAGRDLIVDVASGVITGQITAG